MKRIFLTCLSACVYCGLLCIACNNSAEHLKSKGPELSSEEAYKTVVQGQQLFMNLFKKGDSTGVAGLYTTDAKVMNAGQPAAEGRDNIIRFFGSIFKTGPLIITVKTISVWDREDMIVEEGKWIMADKEGKAYDHGKYLILWKMEDGAWKKFRDCHNSDIYPAKEN
jgi:ketosteroid isomerase-like protein